jgi:hypothetical protein
MIALALLLAAAPDCASCHADIAAQWAQSAHRHSSFNNPYYAVSAREFRRERGERAFAFCARCHDPALVEAGAIGRAFDERSRAAQAGIACLACHSITDTHGTVGNGRYVSRRDPVPLPPGPAHGARLRPALLGEATFCSTCHKVGLAPEVTHDVWLRGQDDYDPWQSSAIAGQGAGAPRRPPETRRCQDCHMPPEPAVLGDRAAKGGTVLSHRFLAANAALPALQGDADALARIATFLRGAVSVDVVPVRRGADQLIDVVLRNRRVGHRFPGGTGDSNEAWVEVELLDAAGVVVARAGGPGADGELAPDTHTVRAQPVDGAGQPIARRDPQHMRGVVFDASIGPADPQVVRYRAPAGGGAVRVRARVRYRKFSPAYARRACAGIADPATRGRCQAPPTLLVAEIERPLTGGEPREYGAWLDHGLGLVDGLAERSAEARPSLERARTLAPDRPEPLNGLARLALAEGRTADVLELVRQAAALAPAHPAPLYLRALALLRAYRDAEAVEPLEALVQRLPHDRYAWVLLGRARSSVGDTRGVLAAAAEALAIDAESADAHHLRMLALRAMGLSRAARREERAYLYYRVHDERNQRLRLRFAAEHPSCAQELYGAHEHVLAPVAAGS